MGLLVEHALIVLVGRRAQVGWLHQVVVLVRLELVGEVDAENRREGRAGLHLVAEEVVGAAVRIERTAADASLARVARRAAVAVAAQGPVGLDDVGRAGVRAAVAALRDVARIGGGTAHPGALGVGRTIVADAVAALGEVARARRRPAERGALRVGWTVIVHAVTALRDVARAAARPARRRTLGVRRAGDAVAVAGLGGIARARRRPADERPGRAVEGVGRAVGTETRAALRDVARTGRRPAGRRRGREGVERTVVGEAVAALGDVARARCRAARCAALGVGGTIGARARAVLGRI